MHRAPLTPHQQWDPQLLLKAQGIRVVFFDVDGVLTDGGLYFSAQGEELKRFHTLDGHGIKMLQKAGVTPAVVTGRDSAPLRLRLTQLGVQHVRYGTEDKVPAAESILSELGLQWDQAAAMGDDWPDLPMMRRSRFAGAPANAHDEALHMADWISSKCGGDGAVRQFCDLLLAANGAYAHLLAGYGS